MGTVRKYTRQGRIMATLNGGSRRTSYATASRETTSSSSAGLDHNDRKTSLKEKPSYRDEASSALHRKDDLTKMGDRLKEGKDLLNEDLSSKPWLKYIAQRKISRKESLERVSEDSSPAYDNGSAVGTFTATPVMASGSEVRTRNLSRSTTSSSEGSFYSENSYYEY